MATRRRATPKKRKPISDKTRASDDELRERLRNFDSKAFDKLLKKAMQHPSK